MSELIVWKNQEIRKLRRDMDRLFSRIWTGFGAPGFPAGPSGIPSFDLSETEDSLILQGELPDIKPEDLDISVGENQVTIKGEMHGERTDDDGPFQRVERTFGSFSRTIKLPCKVKLDDIKATYKDGVLNIMMTKSGPEKARGIKIEVA